LENAPVTGEILSARDALGAGAEATGALLEGNTREAVRNVPDVVLGLLGALPGLGMVARGARRLPRGSFELDFFDTPVKILQNPTERELKGFLDRTKFKAARRIVDPETGEVFVWDASDPALHALVAEKLGVDPQKMIADSIALD